MSKASLFSYVAYRKAGAQSAAHPPVMTISTGVSSCSVDQYGFVDLVVGSVEMPKNLGLTAPADGLLMLYGEHDAENEIAEQLTLARSRTLSFRQVESVFDIKRSESQVTESTLADVNFVRLDQMDSSLLAKIVNYFRAYIQQDGAKPLSETGSSIRSIVQRPDLLARLCKEPEFQHLHVIVFPIVATGFLRQYAYVRPLVNTLTINYDRHAGMQISLPKWLPLQRQQVRHSA